MKLWYIPWPYKTFEDPWAHSPHIIVMATDKEEAIKKVKEYQDGIPKEVGGLPNKESLNKVDFTNISEFGQDIVFGFD